MEPQPIGKLLNQNLELARQEQSPSKLGEGQLIQAIQTSSRIAQAPYDEIVKVLRLSMLKVGLRAANLPSHEETAVLISHIITNYGGNTVAEIRLAFDMAISGKLDVEAKCYENFSCAYFSEIMNAYRAWAVQEYRQNVKTETPEQKILTQEDLDNLHREDIENYYQRLRAGKIPHSLPVYFKEILEKDGLLKSETVAEFFTRKLGLNAEHIYRRDI